MHSKPVSRGLRTAFQTGFVAAIMGLLGAFTGLNGEQMGAIAAALMVLSAVVLALTEQAAGRTLFEPVVVDNPADVARRDNREGV